MSEREMGSLLTNTAVALFAGALGSVLTLTLTNGMSVDDTDVAHPAIASDALVDQDRAGNRLTPEAQPAAAASQDPLVELRQSLANASAERSQLSETVIQLTRKLDELESSMLALDANNQALQSLNAGVTEALDIGETGGDQDGGILNDNGPRNGRQRVQSLIAAGVDEQTARSLQSRTDQYQLARLELFDQAAREGWSDSDQLGERLAELDSDRVDLRSELGDEGYDRYLYESGAANRVNIDSIISGSAADLAGLQIGDLIVSYAGATIFQVRELQAATRDGIRGEYVQVVFDRGGQSLSADVPRGPLGVTLSTARINP